VVLITGAAKGIGAALAKAFAGEGAVVYVNYCHDRVAAEKVVSEIVGSGGKAIATCADVREAPQVEAMVRQILGISQRLDILINNAGIAGEGLLLETGDSLWLDVMATNVNGVYHCTKAVLKPMLLQGGGRIVNISSVLAERPWRGCSSYAASKGAVNAFTKAVAMEVATKNITVNAIAPGVIATEMSRPIIEVWEAKLQEMLPMRRFGTPEEVASLALFLASPAAAYITGKIFGIDGGLL
jgi:3-oxoacyl-[acyl-carrier protein] reductase